MGYEPELLSDGDAGLQPELLADAVPPRRGRRGRHFAAHHTGHGAVEVSVHSGEDLESCRANRCELQRYLRRKRAVRKADGSVARHHAAGWQLRARAGGGADVNSARDADEPDKATCTPRTTRRSRICPAETRSGVSGNRPPRVGAPRTADVRDTTPRRSEFGPAVHRILCTRMKRL